VELLWRQTQAAWIAAPPEYADERGQSVQGQISPAVQNLCVHLLELAGMRACVPFTDARPSDFIRSQGRLVTPKSIRLEQGHQSECHANCAALWPSIKDRYRLMTGYGLSGNMWRRHTWLADDENEVIETTIPRDLYFGVALSNSQAEAFCQGYTKT
jgi:hypothetical protein